MSAVRVAYMTAIGLSAALLFLVQPMVGKMLLPRLGGSPLVWNTCMLFFQAALLAGYAYAHLLGRLVRPRYQLLAHAPALALPLLVLPLGAASAGFHGEGWPVPWLLGTLAVMVGLPFFTLSTTGPLLQRWFAWTGDPDAGNPYFLYAVSNFGSLAALLAYPTVVEPFLPLAEVRGSQTVVWSAGYVAFVAMTALCGLILVRHSAGARIPARSGPGSAPGSSPVARRRLLWLVLAFVPSSAMLGATQFLTTDLAAIPLLWILPLATYLLTFIVAFLGRPLVPRHVASVALAVLAVASVASFPLRGVVPPLVLIPLHLVTLLAVGLVCHGRLADDRPAADHLTGFYLTVGAGGALGGVFSAIVAPLVFNSLLDYPIALLLACLMRPPLGAAPDDPVRARRLDLAVPAGIAVLAFAAAALIPSAGPAGGPSRLVVVLAVPALLATATLARPLRFALGLVVVLVAAWSPDDRRGEVLHAERTFFGIHRVIAFDPSSGASESRLPSVHNLYHGTTKHGMQIVQERLRRVPTLYFHPQGPIGAVFKSLRDEGDLHVGVIGLGAGALAAYGLPGQSFTFYEIDPAVVRIARDTRYFTYLADCRARTDVVLGDGRLSISRAPDGLFGLIVLDAFSSDALPVHLITREAVELYLRKLGPEGLLALNLTNSYVDLEPVVDAIASDLGLSGAIWRDRAAITTPQLLTGKVPSTWVVLARDPGRIAKLGFPVEAQSLPHDPRGRPDGRFLWTDDYSNLIATLRRR